jgi:hypothetical protein
VIADSLAIVHGLPGRLRLRVPSGARTDGLAEAVTAQPGVTSARFTPATRGLLVLFAPEQVSPEAVIDAVAAHADVGAPAMPDLGHDRSPTPLGATIAATVGQANARFARATGGRADLGILVPVALTAWALAEIARGRAGALGWSTALWYAHGLFRDYALPPSHAPVTPQTD